MKIAIFNGGPRKNGRTSSVTASVRKFAEVRNAVTEEHFLYFMDIKGCLTCGTKTGIESARAMAKEFSECDLAVLASPIYMCHITDSLKAFMEILCAVCKDDDDVAEKVKGKKVAAIFTTDVDENVATDAIRAARMLCDHVHAEFIGELVISFADMEKINGKECQTEIEQFTDEVMRK
jgi:multimeric flavodoxin WrbA